MKKAGTVIFPYLLIFLLCGVLSTCERIKKPFLKQ